jgi:NAD(P)-dependent dehydrogenase (short-subunit alcohol dehydrogenase family)
MKLIDGKVAIITGGAQGIGAAICEVFAENGANVVVADVAFDGAKAVAEKINKNGMGKAVAVKVDVTDPASVQNLVDGAVKDFGKVDILVNSAGVLRPHLIIDFPVKDWDFIFAVNTKGTFLVSQAVARQMIAKKIKGSIISISSASGKKADREESAYCASKSAVNGFTRCLALELGEYGIRANAILPGATDTEMLRKLFEEVPGVREDLLSKTPLGKMAEPRDQANAALFLASDLASHVTGECMVVSGGEFMDA